MGFESGFKRGKGSQTFRWHDLENSRGETRAPESSALHGAKPERRGSELDTGRRSEGVDGRDCGSGHIDVGQKDYLKVKRRTLKSICWSQRDS